MAGLSNDAVLAATGREWRQWRAHLDASGAAGQSHKDIARALHDAGLSGWWAQMVTVEYERMIGRRAVGQRCDGAFSVSASRTVDGEIDAALQRWLSLIGERIHYGDATTERPARVSASADWRYWKVDLDDGSRVSVTICCKGASRATIAVGHEKLADADTAARWKSWWKARLAEL